MSLHFCSPFTYVNHNEQANQNVDTNIVQLGFEYLKNMQVQMGDPKLCKYCQTVLSHISKIYSKQEYQQQKLAKPIQKEKEADIQIQDEKLNNQIDSSNGNQQQQKEDCLEKDKEQIQLKDAKQHQQDESNQQQVKEGKVEKIVQEQEEEEKKGDNVFKQSEPNKKDDFDLNKLQDNDSIWVCEFCDTKNILQIEKEEIPKTEDQVYIVQSCNQIKGNSESDISIIFCIDFSGSMSVSQQIKGKFDFKHNFSQEEYEMLKQFIEPGFENQYFPYQNQNTTWVSRKQCVMAAIQNQLEELKKEHPNRKVGIVSFNNDVILIGDGKNDPVILTGDKLLKTDVIREQSKISYQQIMTLPISESSQYIIDRFSKFEERGQTALGPALLASIELAGQGKPGSMVLLCTDGLANVGLGSLDGNPESIEESKQFYQELENIAKQRDIQISIISLKGEGCKFEIIGKLTDATNGNITRVDPDDLSKNFANIFKDDIVATKVEVEIQLHKGFKFRNADIQEDLIEGNGSICKRKIGIATSNTKVNFEYTKKTKYELKEDNICYEGLKELPFQVRFYFTTPDGHRALRVVTRLNKVTTDLFVAENQSFTNIIHSRVKQQTARLFSQGNQMESKSYNKQWEQYINNSHGLSSTSDQQQMNQQFLNQNKILKNSLRSTQMFTMNQEQMNLHQQNIHQNPLKSETFQSNSSQQQNQLLQQQQQQHCQPLFTFQQPQKSFSVDSEPQYNSMQSPQLFHNKHKDELSVIKEQNGEDTLQSQIKKQLQENQQESQLNQQVIVDQSQNINNNNQLQFEPEFLQQNVNNNNNNLLQFEPQLQQFDKQQIVNEEALFSGSDDEEQDQDKNQETIFKNCQDKF